MQVYKKKIKKKITDWKMSCQNFTWSHRLQLVETLLYYMLKWLSEQQNYVNNNLSKHMMCKEASLIIGIWYQDSETAELEFACNLTCVQKTILFACLNPLLEKSCSFIAQKKQYELFLFYTWTFYTWIFASENMIYFSFSWEGFQKRYVRSWGF